MVDISGFLAVLMVVGVIAIGEIAIVFLIWLENKIKYKKK